MTYSEHVRQSIDLSVSEIIRISKDMLPSQYRSRPWELVNHGINLLDSEEQLCAYISAYGEMHWAKCRAAFQNFPFSSLLSNFEIVDWGCGQGIGSITLIEMLRERDKLNLLHKVTLIEPSEVALKRAHTNIDKATNHNITILTHQKYLPYNNNLNEIKGIEYEYPVVIHLFSNILDIQSINLEKLAYMVGTSGPKHYVMCMGPKNTGAYRIDQFCSIFNVSDFISNIDNNRYGYTADTHHPYSCKTKCLEFNNGHLSTQNIHHFVAPTMIGDTPIYDDYDKRILLLNNVTTKHIEELNSLFGKELDIRDSIYVKPNINGDTPDMVVVRPDKGILLVNVCESASEEEVQKAINTIQTYQQNLIQLHLKDLMGRALIDYSNWSLIKMMLYFPSLTTQEAKELCKDCKHVNIFGNDLLKDKEHNLLRNLSFTYNNRYFDRVILNRFIDIISPKWHSYKQGKHIVLTKAQKPLSKSEAKAQRKINGVAGAGKTQILVTRAVNAHLRTGRPVLILTYNLTLVNYIRYRVGEVREDFSWDNIIISNYHQFFKTVANNHQQKIYLSSFEDQEFFENSKNKLTKYSAIFVDEVQDYKTEWLRILHKYFLDENGEFVVFGDAKQNIYKRPLDESGQIRLDFIRGGWNNSLTRSMRFANTQLASMAMSFQRSFYQDQQQDNIETAQTLSFDTCIKYWSIDPNTDWQTVLSNCQWIMNEYKLQPKDVVILSQYCDTLREIDYSYRQNTKCETSTTYETKEQYDNLRKKYGVADNNSVTIFKFTQDIKRLRKSKRLHFTMDTNLVKMSTIHSYKGWEAKAVILVLTPTRGQNDRFEEHFENMQSEQSLIYTAITRAKEKLFILNMGNTEFHNFFNTYR